MEERIERDDDLMKRVRNGDRSAFNCLVQVYWRPLNQFAAGFVELSDAEDIVQEVLIRVWQRRSEWKSSGSVQAYLYRITRNLSLNHQRHQRIRLAWVRNGSRLAPPTATPEDILTENDLRDSVWSALQCLSPRRREVFMLAYFQKLTYREIGDILDLAPQTVANYMSAALADLRKRLRPLLRSDTEVEAAEAETTRSATSARR